RNILLIGMRMFFVVLSQQVFAVIVAVRRAHNNVDVLTERNSALIFGKEPPHARGALVVELNQQHGTVYAVVENAVGLVASDPGEVRLVKMLLDVSHLHSGVAL